LHIILLGTPNQKTVELIKNQRSFKAHSSKWPHWIQKECQSRKASLRTKLFAIEYSRPSGHRNSMLNVETTYTLLKI